MVFFQNGKINFKQNIIQNFFIKNMIDTSIFKGFNEFFFCGLHQRINFFFGKPFWIHFDFHQTLR